MGTSKKIGLDKEEIKRMELLELEAGSPVWHARNTFLYMFYLAGIRIGDALKTRWGDISGGRLYYQMDKNEKTLSLKLSQKSLDLLSLYEQYKESNDGFVFLDLRKANLKDPKDVRYRTDVACAKINRYLSNIAEMTGIDKKITCHIARHSFGNIAGSTIPVQMLQKLYRHSNLATTIRYQSNFDHNKTDEALSNVLDF